MAGPLESKVAIITGGTSRIGVAYVQVFAAQGAKVVIGDLQQDKALGVIDDTKKKGGDTIFVRLNVSTEDDWRTIANTAVKTYGSLITLVNNGVIYNPGDVEEETTLCHRH